MTLQARKGGFRSRGGRRRVHKGYWLEYLIEETSGGVRPVAYEDAEGIKVNRIVRGGCNWPAGPCPFSFFLASVNLPCPACRSSLRIAGLRPVHCSGVKRLLGTRFHFIHSGNWHRFCLHTNVLSSAALVDRAFFARSNTKHILLYVDSPGTHPVLSVSHIWKVT